GRGERLAGRQGVAAPGGPHRPSRRCQVPGSSEARLLTVTSAGHKLHSEARVPVNSVAALPAGDGTVARLPRPANSAATNWIAPSRNARALRVRVPIMTTADDRPPSSFFLRDPVRSQPFLIDLPREVAR